MNTFASLIQQRKSNNSLMGWLHKPTMQQLGANLAPLQNFVKRTAKGGHFNFGGTSMSDDQTVATMSTWDDRMLTHGGQSPTLRQTVVIVSHEPPVASITASRQEAFMDRTAMLVQRQRKSQQKNKVLMLLQLEQVATSRIALREKWQSLRKDLFLEVVRCRTTRRRRLRSRKLRELDQRIQTQRRAIPSNKALLDLETFYRKFDACLDELHDRNEIMELEAFKQLVIREVEERGEALQDFRERMKIVHGQLMQKFIVDELIEGGLYFRPTPKARFKETINEWIQIDEHFCNQQVNAATAESICDGPEWVICDFQTYS